MPRIDLKTLARELLAEPAPAAATLRVQAWAGDKAYTEISGAEVIFAPVREVVFTDGIPAREVYLEPTGVRFCFRLDLLRSGNVLVTRFVAVPDVDEVEFGALRQVDPTSFAFTDETVTAWEMVRAAAAASEAIAVASAGSASASAGTASQAAVAASNSAGAAGLSAGAAADSAAASEQSRALAAGRATSASNSADAAAGSASTASTKAGEAASSASAAAGAAGTATTKAGEASTSAGNAATSAGQASTSAGTASTKAGEASTSAGAAATSASDAAAARNETIVSVGTMPDWGTISATLVQTATRSAYLRRRLTGNPTIGFAAGVANVAYSCTLELLQDGTGGRVLTLANVATPYGAVIPLSTASGATDIIRLEWNGTRWAAFLAGVQMAVPTAWVV